MSSPLPTENESDHDADHDLVTDDGDNLSRYLKRPPPTPWELEYARGRWTFGSKHYFNHNHARVTAATYHRNLDLLLVGLSSGVFCLHTMPDFETVHILSVSQHPITTVCFNKTGEWLALGCAALGQLLVWEWQSETYVLKQQGHFFDTNCLSFSPDGALIVSGGDDGKVKLWSVATGLCFVTFTEHSGPVTAVSFSGANSHTVYSCSLDGTVRAFDLVRYRNFRTMTAPRQSQFISLAVDPSGEVVVCGAIEPFDICVWSIQTGKLLDVLAGHSGPVSCLAFNPMGASLVSGSWDKTVRTWDIFAKRASPEELSHLSDVLALAFRPDGLEICTASLDGNLIFWNVANGCQTSQIEGRRDVAGGRKHGDLITARNNASGKAFTSVCYSADGRCVLAGGNSKYVCIYECSQGVLVKKFSLSNNRSLDGVLDFLNSAHMTESGPLALLQDIDDDSDREDEMRAENAALPGVLKGDLSKRRTRLAIRTKCVQFSPTGRMWAAATTEGLMIYSLDDGLIFDPSDLDMDVTPASIRQALLARDFVRALTMALRLGEDNIILGVVEDVPVADIQLVASALVPHRLDKLFRCFAQHIEGDRHLEFEMIWIRHLLNGHSAYIADHAAALAPCLRDVYKIMNRKLTEIGSICDENKYSLDYLLCQGGWSEVKVPDVVVAIETAIDVSKRAKKD